MKRLTISCAVAAGLGLVAGPAFAANDADHDTSLTQLENTQESAILAPVMASQQIDSVESSNGFVQLELVARTHDQYVEAQRIASLDNAKREMGFSPISISVVAVDASASEAPIASNELQH